MFKHQVRLEHATPDTGIRLHRELQEAGFMLEKDYVWRYLQPRYSDFGIYDTAPKAVVFEFRDPALATFYQLKWQ